MGDPSADSISEQLEELLFRELKRLGDDFLPGPSYIKKFGHMVDSSGTVPYAN
jgi:hypothetical protein